MRQLLILLLFLCWSVGGASFTDFYVQTTGNNLNSGHTPDDSATFSATGGFFTNNTSASVCTYFKSGLNPDVGGVTNGAWASIYPDAATTNVFVGLVTAHDDTADTITVSLTAKAGTVPASDTSGAGATSIKVGGAWRGPNTNGINTYDSVFPFTFINAYATNATDGAPFVNFKSGTYSVTNSITANQIGPIWYGGYTTTPRDGGRATIDGGTVYPSYILLNVSALNQNYANLIFDHNGASGASSGFQYTGGGESLIYRCAFLNMGGNGLYANSAGPIVIECEAATNNISNSASSAGFRGDVSSTTFIRCVSHDNAGSNSDGFSIGGTGTANAAVNCISYKNGKNGFTLATTTFAILIGCNAWNNTGAGIDQTANAFAGALITVQNCNIFKNGTFGINASGSPARAGIIQNCVFGSGTQTNSSGNIGPIVTGSKSGMWISGTITYPTDTVPWVDSTNGNFTLASTATIKASGIGSFLQTSVNSPTNTVSYPDIGAAQSASTNSAAAGGAYTWAQ